MKVKVDRKLCKGLANCVLVAPTVFQLDKENKAVVLEPSSVDEDTVWSAAESCTQDAIFLYDDNGRQLYP